MSDPRGRLWKIILEEDRGVWLLFGDPLIRWLTSSDSTRLATALSEAASHLQANPLRSKTKTRPR